MGGCETGSGSTFILITMISQHHPELERAMDKTETNEKVSTRKQLSSLINKRAHSITIAPDFTLRRKKTDEFYHFLEADSRGISACERIYHPRSKRWKCLEDLCVLIQNGTSMTFELSPSHQQAVRFCEILLGMLNENEIVNQISNPTDHYLQLSGDFSGKDGLGPSVLNTPVVIGFTCPDNGREYNAQTPAVIWSRYWLLTSEPINKLINRVYDLASQYNPFPSPDVSNGRGDGKVEYLIRKLIDILRDWVESRNDKASIEVEQMTLDLLLPLLSKSKQNGCTTETIKLMLERVLSEQYQKKEWTMMIRAPASMMFEKASMCFNESDNVVKDCWGHPVTFDMVFGKGVVKVRCAGMVELIEPAVEKPVATTQEGQSEPAVEQPVATTQEGQSEPAVEQPVATTQEGQPRFAVEKPVATTQEGQSEPAVVDNTEESLTIAEAALYANVSTRTIRTWLMKKTSGEADMLENVVRCGRKILIPRESLSKWRKEKKSTKKFAGTRFTRKKA